MPFALFLSFGIVVVGMIEIKVESVKSVYIYIRERERDREGRTTNFTLYRYARYRNSANLYKHIP